MRTNKKEEPWLLCRLLFSEHVLRDTADWADPISWDFFEWCSWCDSAVWIAYLRIINISAGTNVLFHDLFLLSEVLSEFAFIFRL